MNEEIRCFTNKEKPAKNERENEENSFSTLTL